MIIMCKINFCNCSVVDAGSFGLLSLFFFIYILIRLNSDQSVDKYFLPMDLSTSPV